MNNLLKTYVGVVCFSMLVHATPRDWNLAHHKMLGTNLETYSNYKEVEVEKYTLDLNVDPVAKTYSGSAKYTIKMLRDARRVIFDVNYLKVTAIKGAIGNNLSPSMFRQDKDRLIIVLSKVQKKGSRFELTAFFELDYSQFKNHPIFKGDEHGDNDVPEPGIWFFDAQDGESGKPSAHTHHETTFMRATIPCQDFTRRALWETTIRVPAGYTAHATGKPIGSSGDGTTSSFTYKMDLPTSPYLFAFFVGDLEERVLFEGNENLPKVVLITEKSEGSKVMNQAIDHAERTVKILEYFQRKDVLNRKFQIDYLRLAYVPSKFDPENPDAYSAPTVGMENRGLITFSKEFVLDFMKKNLPYDYRAILVHELGHEHFGNEVTCKTWEDLTVNEGSVTALHQLATAAVFPEIAPLVEKQWQVMRKKMASAKHNKERDPILGSLKGDYNERDRIGDAPNGRDFYYKGAWIFRIAQNMFPEVMRERALTSILRSMLPSTPSEQIHLDVMQWMERIQSGVSTFASDNSIQLDEGAAYELIEQLVHVPGMPQLQVSCSPKSIQIEGAFGTGSEIPYDLGSIRYKTIDTGAKSKYGKVSLSPIANNALVTIDFPQAISSFALDPAGESFAVIHYAESCKPMTSKAANDYRLLYE